MKKKELEVKKKKLEVKEKVKSETKSWKPNEKQEVKKKN